MPFKRLPTSIVNRLRRAHEHGNRSTKTKVNGATIAQAQTDTERFVGRLRNIDSRRRMVKGAKNDIDSAGRRVRELTVSGQKIVIKRVHGGTSLEVLKILRGTVDAHNKKHPNTIYKLLKPVGHPIGNDFIAMQKMNSPTITEILHETYKTKKGQLFYERLKHKHWLDPRCSIKRLRKATELVEGRTASVGHEIKGANLVLVGFEKGKFVFVPLMDLF